MMPNLGQGGCMAIEDAFVLGRELSRIARDEAPNGSLTLLRRQCKEVLVLMSSGTPFCSKCSNEESQPRSSHRHFASPTHLAAPALSSLEGSTLTRQLVR